jgi:hypothetical protein
VDAEDVARVREALAVVAGAGADHTGRLLVVAELGDQVVGAAELVGPADLQVFPLQPDLGAGALGQPEVALQRRPHRDVVEAFDGGLDGCRINDLRVGSGGRTSG